MTIDEALRGIAGAFVLASVALGWFISPWWFLFTAFVGSTCSVGVHAGVR
jgi:hypothetical protein